MIDDAIPDDTWKLAEEMMRARAKWTEIARATGLSAEKIRRRLDPEFRARRNRQANASRIRILREITPAAKVLRATSGSGRVTPKEAERALLSVPPDTRGLTARIFGDPLPGRSALDRMRAQQ